jgi:hypothetical protein
VGFFQNSGSTAFTLAERWNGTNWTVQSTPNPATAANARLYGVSCKSATSCTAVGYWANASGSEFTLAERWNGTNWVVQSTPNVAGAAWNDLYAVGCSSALACTAVGASTDSVDETLALRYA